MSKIIKYMILIPIAIMLLVGVIYVGSCVYGNFIEKEGSSIKYPAVEKAQYKITIKNTGNTIFTNEYEHNGDIYILHGYWEIVKGKYIYREHEATIDISVFGDIKLDKRQ